MADREIPDHEMDIEVVDTRDTALIVIVYPNGSVHINCSATRNGEPDYAWVAETLRCIADGEDARRTQ